MNIADTYRDGRRCISEGLCLRRLDYGNTSQVISLLTPDNGRIDCMFKGAWRAPGKGISVGIDLMGRYRLVYRESGSGASLDTLLDCSMIEHFGALRLSVDRAICGYYAVELMRNFTTHGQSCRELYGTVLDALRRFASGEGLGMGVIQLEVAVLKHYGSCPDFSSCVACRRDWRPAGAHCFSTFQSGVLCRECGEKLPDAEASLPLKLPVVKFLERVCSDKQPAPGAPGPGVIVEASKILRYHMSWMLGKELRMWRYLHSRHYSRSVSKIRSQIGPGA